MDMMIQYGGRAAGAYLAHRYLGERVGGGWVGTLSVIALGWLAGGIVADYAASKIAS